LVEIEELVNALGKGLCDVRPTGCLGYCSLAPAALVRKPGRDADPGKPFPPPVQRVHVKIKTLQDSANVVEDATGKAPPMDQDTQKFADLRLTRTRAHARSIFHWNTALYGFAEQVVRQPQLLQEYVELLALAGYGEGGDVKVPGTGEGAGVEAGGGVASSMPVTIAQYSQWSVEEVVPVSKHSAVWRLASRDRKRGTPHPRGCGVLPTPKTWHTTLLAEVGANEEGPLPWIERDYTPVSTAKEWEQGRCDILIKIYADGAATSWLHRASSPRLWLSKPVQTLAVPGLVPNGEGAFAPQSVLLLLAGTGVVALPQVLHHRDPIYKLGISTPRRTQLAVPIDVVLSFREDDVLHLREVAEYCREAAADATGCRGVRNCTFLLTAANTSSTAPFPGMKGGDGEEAEGALNGLANARILRSRLNGAIVADALARMIQPCRVVVSGPGGFNAAAREMLTQLIDEEQITVLAA